MRRPSLATVLAVLAMGTILMSVFGDGFPVFLSREELVRRWSGAGLAVLVVGQACLGIAQGRVSTSRVIVLRRWHERVGLLLLLSLWAHAPEAGYGYLGILGVLIPVQILLGWSHPWARRAGKQVLWSILHRLVAAVLISGIGVHLWMVFAYKA